MPLPPHIAERDAQNQEEILEGMARALWVTSYANWADEHRDEVEVAGPGEDWDDWDDIAPETPDAAMKAAKDLAALFEQANSGGYDVDVTMAVLYTRAHEAMTGRPEMRRRKNDTETFGWYMAMQAMGEGVSWFDDHPQFEVTFPRFEAWFDGEELQWSGGMIHRNPGKRLWLVVMINHDPKDTHAVELESRSEVDVREAISEAIDLANPDEGDSIEYTITESDDPGAARLMGQTWQLYKGSGRPTTNPARQSTWGFDLTKFKRGGFQNVLRGLGMGSGEELGADGWEWHGRDIAIVTSNNPITGESSPMTHRGAETDYAGYIGIRGSRAKVAEAKRLIKANASYIKDETGASGLIYIGFGDDDSSGRRRGGHRHRRNPHHWPSSEVQSLLFDKHKFSAEQAKHWAKEHGYHYGKVDTTGHYHRLRQEAPTGGPCRTIEFTEGVKAIVCSGGHGLPPGVPR